jgi:hypothetical protein
MPRHALIAGLLVLVLSAYGSNTSLHASPPFSMTTLPSSSRQHFSSETFGFRINYPADFEAKQHFDGNYFTSSGSWKVLAGQNEQGSPVLTLVLKGSNEITRGELRVGVSRDPESIRSCLQPPPGYLLPTQQPSHTKFGGADFATFEVSDAGMGHRLDAHSYRTIHAGACYAIDLLVTGTRADVYDPLRAPPFSDAHALKHLQQALQGFSFTR